MRPRLPAICATLAIFLATPASAGEVFGKIKQLTARDADGLHSVVIDAPIQGSPACATHSYFMIRDENSVAGKSQFAMLMSAFLSGISVRIVGIGQCTRWGDGEDILQVSFSN